MNPAASPDPGSGRRATLRDRLLWPTMTETETPISEDRAMMGRTYGYLFGLGATLALLTLALPHASDRHEVGLVLAAGVAYATAAGFMIGFDRLPMAAFRFSPLLGALLATTVIASGGATAVGAYAAFFFWVVLAAGYFFGLRLALLHVAFCAGCYAFVLVVAQPEAPLPGVYWLMGIGTLLVAGVLMVLLRVQVERIVTQLATDAGTDPLTALSNRRAFEDAFARELERSMRTGQPLGLVVLDLDWFKEVNDMLGHLAGDRALRRLADVLRRETRGIDTVARLGGEEFAVLAPGAGEDEALRLAERLRRQVKTAFADHAKPLTISCGIASFPATGGSSSDLHRAADRALYAAKDLGRDRSVTYRPGETEIAFPESARSGGRITARLPSLVALAEAMDRRKGSPGHSRLVGRYSEELARRLGLDDDDVERAALAGLLHDIGTVGISEATLVKQGPLTPEEWAEIRKHPEVGARIVTSADLEGIGEVIIAHHERPDGSGYPSGMSGDEIPLAARIVAVADAYAAMTADRSYRAGIGVDAALAELRSHAGSQFDPKLVEAFVALDRDLRGEPETGYQVGSRASRSRSATK